MYLLTESNSEGFRGLQERRDYLSQAGCLSNGCQTSPQQAPSICHYSAEFKLGAEHCAAHPWEGSSLGQQLG